MESPTALALKMKGIDRYHAGEWMEAFESLDAALHIDPDFVEDHFNAALALHHREQQAEATQQFRMAGELDLRNAAIVHGAVFRNLLGLAATLERHLSGGCRYQP